MMGAAGNALVPAALFGWVPLVGWLFSKVSPRQAAALAFAGAWMFLPVASIPFKGLPDYTKVTATCVGIFAAAWIFDREKLSGFRPGAVDLPIALWCSAPLLSSLANGLGAYDGLSESMYQSFTWGLPYFVGRIYFADVRGLTTLAVTVVAGGLLYIPFCLFEMIMSPQLHRLTYGYHQHSFLQTMRGNGFRPMVFMEHGLMVAMWMVSASMTGLWMGYAGTLPKAFSLMPGGGLLKKLPLRLLLGGLLAVTFVMKSTGALLLQGVGLFALYFSHRMKTALVIWALLLVAPGYMVARSTGIWTGENLTALIAEKFSEERAQSLQFRFDNEKILIDKALDGTFFGWGGWGRSRVFDEDGRDISVTDGLWIITLGVRGLYGLMLLTVILLLPVVLFLWRCPPGRLGDKSVGPVAAMSILLLLYMIDNLLNAMVNPVFMLFNGGICGLFSRADALSENEGVSEEKSASYVKFSRIAGSDSLVSRRTGSNGVVARKTGSGELAVGKTGLDGVAVRKANAGALTETGWAIEPELVENEIPEMTTKKVSGRVLRLPVGTRFLGNGGRGTRFMG